MSDRLVWIAILAFFFSPMILPLRGAGLARQEQFESVPAFVNTAKAFEPAMAKGEMAALFTVKELGQLEDPRTGKPISAKVIDSCDILWSDDSFALVCAKASPPTESTHSVVCVIFLLKHERETWQIADLLRFTAYGKYSGIEAKLTARGYKGNDEPDVITVTEFQGGRGASRELSASYSCKNLKFKRLELE